jgi:hypothetical protein
VPPPSGSTSSPTGSYRSTRVSNTTNTLEHRQAVFVRAQAVATARAHAISEKVAAADADDRPRTAVAAKLSARAASATRRREDSHAAAAAVQTALIAARDRRIVDAAAATEAARRAWDDRCATQSEALAMAAALRTARREAQVRAADRRADSWRRARHEDMQLRQQRVQARRALAVARMNGVSPSPVPTAVAAPAAAP